MKDVKELNTSDLVRKFEAFLSERDLSPMDSLERTTVELFIEWLKDVLN